MALLILGVESAGIARVESPGMESVANIVGAAIGATESKIPSGTSGKSELFPDNAMAMAPSTSRYISNRRNGYFFFRDTKLGKKYIIASLQVLKCVLCHVSLWMESEKTSPADVGEAFSELVRMQY